MDKPNNRIVLLQAAQNELEEIAAVHFRLVGAQSARAITDRIYHALERLAQFPLSGVQLDDRELRREGYRAVISGDYLCVYRLLGDTVYVCHIVHGATDYPTLLKAFPQNGASE